MPAKYARTTASTCGSALPFVSILGAPVLPDDDVASSAPSEAPAATGVRAGADDVSAETSGAGFAEGAEGSDVGCACAAHPVTRSASPSAAVRQVRARFTTVTSADGSRGAGRPRKFSTGSPQVHPFGGSGPSGSLAAPVSARTPRSRCWPRSARRSRSRPPWSSPDDRVAATAPRKSRRGRAA